MRAFPARRVPYHVRNVEESELALGLSPCPRAQADAAPYSRRPALDAEEPPGGAAVFGWAVALAFAAAVVIHVSGG